MAKATLQFIYWHDDYIDKCFDLLQQGLVSNNTLVQFTSINAMKSFISFWIKNEKNSEGERVVAIMQHKQTLFETVVETIIR